MSVGKGIGGHHSAAPASVDWLTPPWLLGALGPFDLDPCAPVNRPWDIAGRHYTVEDNGLIQPWQGRVFLNPPYTTGIIGDFMGLMVKHGTGTALIFARTETAAFHDTVWRSADAVLFLEGRLHFHIPHAPQPDHPGDHDWIEWGESENKKKPMLVCAKCGVAKANAGAPNVLVAYGEQDTDMLAESGLPGQFVPLSLRGLMYGFDEPGTWIEEVRKVMERADRPMTVAQLYKCLADSPKARRNPSWKAKVRQTLQRGPFKPEGGGVWQLDLQPSEAN